MDDIQEKLQEMGITPELMAELEMHGNLPVVKELKKLNKNLEALVSKEHPMMEMPEVQPGFFKRMAQNGIVRV